MEEDDLNYSDPSVQAWLLTNQIGSALSVLINMPDREIAKNARALEDIEEELCALITRSFNATSGR